jgi:hypothetical protein
VAPAWGRIDFAAGVLTIRANIAQKRMTTWKSKHISEHQAEVERGRGAGWRRPIKREADLSKRYEAHLTAHRVVARYRVRPAGEITDMITDLFDVTGSEPYEVQRVSTRHVVRLAIGRLLDEHRRAAGGTATGSGPVDETPS